MGAADVTIAGTIISVRFKNRKGLAFNAAA